MNARVSAPVTDGTSLPVVVRRLDEEGIAVTELALRLPSLDEVFLALTGHTAEEKKFDTVLEGAAHRPTRAAVPIRSPGCSRA